MLNCRVIPSRLWTHAHEALVYYFSRRHGFGNAEDLAQETLAAILSRDDFEFEKEEDFLKVCYGFARRISLSEYRSAAKYPTESLDVNALRFAAPDLSVTSTEMGVLLDEVLRTAKIHLRDDDWDMIWRTASEHRDEREEPGSAAERNNLRVRLHRARKKLAKLTGWRSE